MRLKCKMCGSDRYVVVSINTVNDSVYKQKNQCMKCSTITEHELSYLSDPKKYKYINVQGNVTQFHRFVYELTHNRKLKLGERVILKNGIKGDCRPSNLIAVMSMKKKSRVINHKILVCKKCQYAWRGRKKTLPISCPKCGSKSWGR